MLTLCGDVFTMMCAFKFQCDYKSYFKFPFLKRQQPTNAWFTYAYTGERQTVGIVGWFFTHYFACFPLDRGEKTRNKRYVSEKSWEFRCKWQLSTIHTGFWTFFADFLLHFYRNPLNNGPSDLCYCLRRCARDCLSRSIHWANQIYQHKSQSFITSECTQSFYVLMNM